MSAVVEYGVEAWALRQYWLLGVGVVSAEAEHGLVSPAAKHGLEARVPGGEVLCQYWLRVGWCLLWQSMRWKHGSLQEWLLLRYWLV